MVATLDSDHVFNFSFFPQYIFPPFPLLLLLFFCTLLLTRLAFSPEGGLVGPSRYEFECDTWFVPLISIVFMLRFLNFHVFFNWDEDSSEGQGVGS